YSMPNITLNYLQGNENIFMDYLNLNSDYLDSVDTSSIVDADILDRYDKISKRVKILPLDLIKYNIGKDLNTLAGQGNLYIKKIANLQARYTNPTADTYTINTENVNPDGESLAVLNFKTAVTN